MRRKGNWVTFHTADNNEVTLDITHVSSIVCLEGEEHATIMMANGDKYTSSITYLDALNDLMP